MQGIDFDEAFYDYYSDDSCGSDGRREREPRDRLFFDVLTAVVCQLC